MNANAFRHFYEYHFLENRKMWNDYIMPLSQEQFLQDIDYSIGSIRNQVVHLMRVDDVWFTELRGLHTPEWPDTASFVDRDIIRARWDAVEQKMRDYLTELRDDMLFDQPFIQEEEDKVIKVWQALLHVVNHGTDHRAQILRLLNDLGAQTTSQDYIFYVYDNP